MKSQKYDDDQLTWLDEWHTSCKHFTKINNTLIINDFELSPDVTKYRKTFLAGVVACGHVPISRKGEPPIGIISVYSMSIKGLFSPEFIELLSNLAGQLAQAIVIVREIEAKETERKQKEQALLHNALIKKEMEIAQQIQQSLLPNTSPQIIGIDIAGRCKTASHVGGDYYDFLQFDKDSIDIIIADVSGHSVGAALVMTEVRTMFRQQARVSRAKVIFHYSLHVAKFICQFRTTRANLIFQPLPLNLD